MLPFENKPDTIVHIGYYLQKVEIKDYDVMIDAMNLLINLLKTIL